MPLKYIGNGKQHITGVPARDLEDNEITELHQTLQYQERFDLDRQGFIDALIRGGLYQAPAPPKKTKTVIENNPEQETE